MGFKQKLLEKKSYFTCNSISKKITCPTDFRILPSAKLAMRVVSPVANEQYRLIEFKIKQVVIQKKKKSNTPGRKPFSESFSFAFYQGHPTTIFGKISVRKTI